MAEPGMADSVDLAPLDGAALLAIAKRRWAWFLLPPVLFGSLAIGLTGAEPPTYAARATIVFEASNGASNAIGGGDPERAIANEAATAMSTAAVESVAVQLGAPVSLLAKASSNANLLTIEARAATGGLAARGANTAAAVFLEGRVQRAVKVAAAATEKLQSHNNQLQAKIEILDRRIAEDFAAKLAEVAVGGPALADPSLSAERDGLLSQQAFYQNEQRRVERASGGLGDASLARAAVAPNAPAGPSLLVPLAAAVVLGAAIGVVLVLLRERLDESVRGATDLQRFAPELDVLDDIRHIGSRRAGPLALSQFAESHRKVFGAVLLSGPAPPGKVLQVCGLVERSGASSIAAGVALAASESGLRVLLVDANLSHPGIARLLGLPDERGLSTLALGLTTFDVVFQRTPLRCELAVLTAGPEGLRFPDLSVEDTLRQLATTWSTFADLVVINSPPPALDANGLWLSSWASNTLLVVSPGRRRSRQLEATLSRLGQVRADVVGAVLTKPARERRWVRRLAPPRPSVPALSWPQTPVVPVLAATDRRSEHVAQERR